MPDSVANLLLKIRGDSDDARRDVDSLSARLAEFDRQEAEAQLTLDTSEGIRELDQLQARLKKFALTETDADVQLKTGAFLKDVAEVQATLQALDAQDVEIDVDIKKSIFDRVSQLTSEFDTLKGGVEEVSGGAGGGGFAGLKTNFAGFIGELGPGMVIVIALAAVLAGALVAALVAATASLAAATAGLIAMAVAGFGAVLAAVPLIIGAISRFKATADTAGTAANGLKVAAQSFGKEFINAIRPATIALFHDLAGALQTLQPVLKDLGPSFTIMARAIGGALRQLAGVFADPAMVGAFKQLVVSGAQLAGPIAQGIGNLARLFINIANAAMPFLVSGAQKVATALGHWADSTDNVGKLQGTMALLVSNMRSWLNLIKQLGGALLALFADALGPGQKFVDWLAKGVEQIKNWLNSTEGKNTLAKFFQDVIPLAQTTISFVAKLIVIFFQFVQIVAPALNIVMGAFNVLLGVLIKVLSFLTPFLQVGLQIVVMAANMATALVTLVTHWDALRTVVGAVMTFILGIVTSVVAAVVTAFNGLLVGLTAAWNAIRAAASLIWNGIKSVVTAIVGALAGAVQARFDALRDAIVAIWNALKAAASAVWNAIKTVVSAAADAARDAVIAVWNAGKSTIEGIWNGIKGAASSVWGAIKSVISSAADGARDAAVSVWNAAKGTLSSIWSSIEGAAHDLWGRVRQAIVNAVEAAKDAVVGLAGAFFSAGKNLILAIINGMESAAGAAIDKAKSIAKRIRDILPFSEPKDPSSPLRGLAKSGQAIMENLAAGIPKGGDALIKEIQAQLSAVPVAAAARVLQPVQMAPNVTVNRTYNIPPGPGGGMDPAFSAAQLDALLREEGILT